MFFFIGGSGSSNYQEFDIPNSDFYILRKNSGFKLFFVVPIFNKNTYFLVSKITGEKQQITREIAIEKLRYEV